MRGWFGHHHKMWIEKHFMMGRHGHGGHGFGRGMGGPGGYGEGDDEGGSPGAAAGSVQPTCNWCCWRCSRAHPATAMS